jgi:hypothetical protein
MSSQPYAAIHFFPVRLSKKYIGQFTHRVGNPVSYPPFIAQFCVTYCTNRALFHNPALLDIHGVLNQITSLLFFS